MVVARMLTLVFLEIRIRCALASAQTSIILRIAAAKIRMCSTSLVPASNVSKKRRALYVKAMNRNSADHRQK